MTELKEIELKEICVDLDIQLPREQCEKKTRDECKYVIIRITTNMKSVQLFSLETNSFNKSFDNVSML